MSDYHLRISGPEGEVAGRMSLAADGDADALRLACAVISPHGHDLCDGDRFLGRFDPPWGEHLADRAEPVEA